MRAKTKAPKPLSADMKRVLGEMQNGHAVEYGTAMISSGRAYLTTASSGFQSIRESTVKGLIFRGLVEKRYAYPTGTIVLTKAGRDYQL